MPYSTHNTRGNMAMTGSLNYYRGAGPAEATEPPPQIQGGPGGASQVLAQSAYRAGRGAHRDAPLPNRATTERCDPAPEDASAATQA